MQVSNEKKNKINKTKKKKKKKKGVFLLKVSKYYPTFLA